MSRGAFKRIIGIDYSGAGKPVDRLRGLAVYRVEDDGPPQRVLPPNKRARNWTREEIARWLVQQLQEQNKPTLVGIDHAFSFPMQYFKKYPKAKGGWDHFLDDFCTYWETNAKDALVSNIKAGCGKHRRGDSKWKRLTDEASSSAKSVFQFGVEGSVAHSTHAGLPWLRCIRRELCKAKAQVHFWPFDGWNICEDTSVVAEVYPALWKGRFVPQKNWSPHQHDAYSVAGWLSCANRSGHLDQYLKKPELSQEQSERAKVEGWILGVQGFIHKPVGKDIRASVTTNP